MAAGDLLLAPHALVEPGRRGQPGGPGTGSRIRLNATFGQGLGRHDRQLRPRRMDRTVPGTLPIICGVSQLPIVGTPSQTCAFFISIVRGRRYRFASGSSGSSRTTGALPPEEPGRPVPRWRRIQLS
ncbi:hypothetical protein HBB16_10535 [Pseudonocardia sp. MCCB 268]|nr:hypothetical protein [Pseudonocardia cytotoxica]